MAISFDGSTPDNISFYGGAYWMLIEPVGAWPHGIVNITLYVLPGREPLSARAKAEGVPLHRALKLAASIVKGYPLKRALERMDKLREDCE
jgi:hypothetical protein